MRATILFVMFGFQLPDYASGLLKSVAGERSGFRFRCACYPCFTTIGLGFWFLTSGVGFRGVLGLCLWWAELNFG